MPPKRTTRQKHQLLSKGTRRNTITNKRRKGLLSILIPWIKRAGKYVALIILVSWIGAWIWFSDSIPRTINWTHDLLVQKSVTLGFTVQNIMVEGRIHTNRDDLLLTLGTKEGDPLLSFTPEKAQAEAKKLPWIRHVNIQRRLPDTIYINIDERIPIGFLQQNSTVHIIDEEGIIVPDKNLSPFKNLPIFRGAESAKYAPALTAQLISTPDIHKRIKSATRVSNRRWDLELRNGILVRLPQDDMGLALKRLSDAQAQEQLLDRNLIGIDLRDPERMTIRAKPGEVQSYEEKKKDAPAV